MSKLSPTNSFVIQGWMVTELHLKGPELITYAIVFQFSQSKAGIFKGGVPYIMAWLGCSDVSARKYLHSLEQNGLITATDGKVNGVPFRDYQITDNQIPKILGGDTQDFCPETPKILGIDYKRDYKRDYKTPPTPSEVAAYCRSRGWRDPEGFARHYCEYNTVGGWKMSNGKPIKNWKQSVLSWETNNKDKVFSQNKDTAHADTPMQQISDEQFTQLLRS